MSFCFDTLGHYRHAETASEVDSRLHNEPVSLAFQHIDHQKLVDLHLIRIEHLEISKRRKAGTVVVDRYLDSGLPVDCDGFGCDRWLFQQAWIVGAPVPETTFVSPRPPSP